MVKTQAKTAREIQSHQTKSLFQSWLVKSILFPFIITRTLLVFIGYLAPYFIPLSYNPDVNIANRGWLFSSHRLIDMWARWDSGWYLTIINEGYRVVENIYNMSNLAFFPGYPLLVKGLLLLVPSAWQTTAVIIGLGVVVSNLLLIGSLILLFKLTQLIFKNTQAAQTAVWLMLVFPSSFFLSAFYTESTFLFFSLLTLWLAKKKQWAWASLAAATTGITRSVGLLIALPLLGEYLATKKWQLKKINWSILWLTLVPMGVLLFFGYLYFLTGDFLAAIKVQNAWGRQISNPWLSFFKPTAVWPLITDLDRLAMASVLLSSLGLIFHKIKGLWSLGLYSILLIIPTLFTGTLDSATRYAMVIFPVFSYWGANLNRQPESHNQLLKTLLLVGLMVLQLILFTRYSQFYWAG